ncbi:MAG: hypothetical protein HQM09_24645 [Candidatus Riflebacteria bacterium]|nr:hypothetical protein [Candidatus Riflebacteria bacterium]
MRRPSNSNQHFARNPGGRRKHQNGIVPENTNRVELQGTKVGLISFHEIPDDHPDYSKLYKAQARCVYEMINAHAEFDLLVFPGWTLANTKTLLSMLKHISNTNTVAILEALDTGITHAISHGMLARSFEEQVFAESSEIEGDETKMEKFLDVFENHRQFSVCGASARLLICGELNVLRNYQNRDNCVDFRFPGHQAFSKKFAEIFARTQIIVNPGHTPMGNQCKMIKRREYLSQSGRLYCYTANYRKRGKKKMSSKQNPRWNRCPEVSKQLLLKASLQYCYYDGCPVTGQIASHDCNHILRIYNI